jgi:hypothetical protein
MAMKPKKFWTRILNFILFLFLQLIGNQRAFSLPIAGKYLAQSSNTNSQQLPEARCSSPMPYARVTAQEGLEVHSRPNGSVIGMVPNRWAVIPINRDATGRWTRITSHFGDNVGTHSRFVSAPLFRSGWVISSSLEDLGLHCEKPVSSLRINLQESSRLLQVHENWLQLGDRIAMVGEE